MTFLCVERDSSIRRLFVDKGENKTLNKFGIHNRVYYYKNIRSSWC